MGTYEKINSASSYFFTLLFLAAVTSSDIEYYNVLDNEFDYYQYGTDDHIDDDGTRNNYVHDNVDEHKHDDRADYDELNQLQHEFNIQQYLHNGAPDDDHSTGSGRL